MEQDSSVLSVLPRAAPPASISAPVPVVRDPPLMSSATSLSSSSYRASSAQQRVVFPLSGPPVLVSIGITREQRGLLRSRRDDTTGVNLIQQTDEFYQKRTPAQKFYLEPSKNPTGLVHVRCAEGNKYLVAHEQDGAVFVAATADKPEEDPTKQSCTMFQFNGNDSGVEFQITHKHISVGMFSPYGPGKLYMQIKDNGSPEIFHISRLSEQKELPKYVLIKGYNQKYLSPTRTPLHYDFEESGRTWFQEFFGTDSNDQDMMYETFTDDYGLVRLKHYTSGNVCRCLKVASFNYYIISTVQYYNYEIDTNIVEDNTYDVVDSLFKLVIKDDHNIALQSISSGKFLHMISLELDDHGNHYKINPSGGSADSSYGRETSLQIEEPVKSRNIYDVQYRFAGQKTTDTLEMSRQEVIATNGTQQIDHITNSVKKFEKTTSTWDAHLSLDIGIKAKMEVNFPLIAEFQAESHADFHGEYNWGQTTVDSSSSETKVEYDVPPMTRIVCDIYSKVVQVDVPFSYKVKDVLFNGKEAPPRQMHDGIYRGVHSSDVDIKTRQEEMPTII